MPQHKFRVGVSVEYLPGKLQERSPPGFYKITRLLPAIGRDHQYRIKNASEPFERIAQESQLTLAPAT